MSNTVLGMDSALIHAPHKILMSNANNQPLKFSRQTPVRRTSRPRKAKNTKKKGSRKNPSKMQKKPQKPNVHISNCTKRYAMTLTNPFDVHGAGLPCTPVIPSLKQACFVKGTFSTGSNGFGFIMSQPLRAAVNDANFVWSSTASTTIFQSEIADPNTAAYRSNAPYTASQLSNEEDGFTYRLVSAGLRIRYTGTTLNQGGSVYAISHPSHADLNQATLDEIRALNVTKNFAVDRDWASTLWCPVLPADYAYRFVLNAETPNMLFIVSCPSGTPLSFEFEAHCNFEYVGAPIRGMTPSQADAVGFTAVQSALQGSSMTVVPRGSSANQQGLMTRMENGILTEASHVGSYLWDHKWDMLSAAAAAIL